MLRHEGLLMRAEILLTPEEAARYARMKSLFDLEEAERILATQRDQGRPLADILQRLHAESSRE
jgi:hypothetical protein